MNTSRIKTQIENKKIELQILENLLVKGEYRLYEDLKKIESLLSKYNLDYAPEAFVNDCHNEKENIYFRCIEKSFELSAAKGNNLLKSIDALNTGFSVSVFNPSEYKGTSLGNESAKVRISYHISFIKSQLI